MFTLMPVALAVLSVVPVALVLGGLAWRKREEPAGMPATVYHLCLAGGAAAYGTELAVTVPTTKLRLAGLGLVFMSGFVGAWVATALAYAGYEEWLTRPFVAALCIEPAVVTAVAFVPGLSDLLFDLPSSGGAGTMRTIGAAAGPVTVAHFGYILLLTVVATGLFVNVFVRSRHLYWAESTALLVTAVAPWITIFIQTFEVVEGVDTSIFTWTLAGVAVTVGLYRVRLLDPVPVGYSSVVETMGDGVLVLGEDDHVGDVNPAAERFFGVESNRSAANRSRPSSTTGDRSWRPTTGNGRNCRRGSTARTGTWRCRCRRFSTGWTGASVG